MKKISFSVLFLGLLVLAGCGVDYPAEESHLEEVLLSGQSAPAQLMFTEGTLKVINNNLPVTPNTNPSDIEEMRKEEIAIPQNGDYNVEISASGDTYEIQTEDGTAFTLTRVGERIFEDEDGNTYDTTEYIE